jgi:membrane-associated phospholipid phosphatase
VNARFAAIVLAIVAAVAASSSARAAEPPRRIVWDYPRFRPAEATWTAGVMLTAIYVELKEPTFSPDNGWHRGVLFDDAVRDTLRAPTRAGRERAALISNYLWHSTQYFPVLIDGLIAPLAFDRSNTDAALQLTLLNWETQVTTLFLVRFGHRAIGRWRPAVHGCADDPLYDADSCDPNNPIRNGSFPAGHTAMAFSGAALTCAHHAALPIYGSKIAGIAACALTMTMATTVAVLRMVSENHWATDNLMGAAIGLGTGFGVPYLLHYGPHVRSRAPVVGVLPWMQSSAGGLTVFAAN